MFVQKKSLEQVLAEKCSPDCISPYLEEFIKTFVEDNKEQLADIRERSPEYVALIIKLISTAYGSGFADAMWHVLATLIKEGVLNFTHERN